VETKASNEEIYDFKSNILCMIVGDEEHLNDVFMQVDEEVRLLDEVYEIEKFFIEHMLLDVEDDAELPQRDEAEKIPAGEVMEINILTKETYEKTSVLHEDHEEDGDGQFPTTVLKIVEEDLRDIDDLVAEMNLLEDWLDYEDFHPMVSMGNSNMIDCSSESENWNMEFLLQPGGIVQKDALEGNEEVHEEIQVELYLSAKKRMNPEV
jgi:hypothetical protein